MARRVGLDRQAVVAAAIELLDDGGLPALTLARLARRLGVRTPSLYNHVDGQPGLHRELWLFAVNDLGDTLRASVAGRTGRDALYAFAHAFRAYVHARPGRYAVSLTMPPRDAEVARTLRRSAGAYRSMISTFGLDREEEAHVGRALRAALHGFVVLEAADSLGRDGVDDSFERLVGLLASGLSPVAPTVAPVAPAAPAAPAAAPAVAG
jgi:AcrR family transcriptional regulator